MIDEFELSMPLWRIAARTSVVYLAIVVLLRIAPKRRTGTLSPNDVIFLVLIAALAGNAISAGAHSIADALSMTGVIVGWSYIFELLEYRFPAIHHLLRDTQTTLVKDGRILRGNMRRELVTEDELMANLREQGIDGLDSVASACLEADGRISVIERDKA